MRKATAINVGAKARDESFYRSILRAGASVGVLGSLLAGQVAYAQDSSSEDESQEEAPADDGEIVVTGIRQSLESA
ncbi:MAG: hypothetical protein AAGL68_09635, partial [Pseudomonadota bacterium]